MMKHQQISSVAALLSIICSLNGCLCFAFQQQSVVPFSTTTDRKTSFLMVAKGSGDDSQDSFKRFDKASRSARDGDTLVELNRPLGLVLKEDEFRNVYVETVAPRGNAARSGKVKEGDYVVMCSSTFGDEMWSTRNAGLSRVLSAIRLRSGATVKLVFESPNQSKKKQMETVQQIKAKEQAALAAQAKRDQLLAELERDEERLNPKKFFGLF